MAFLEIAHVSKSYATPAGEKPVLIDISLEVEPGEFGVVLGPSGCGKTTLLRLISGLDSRYRGRIRVAPGRLGVVFQEPRLLPWLRVQENIRFPLAAASGGPAGDVDAWLVGMGLRGYGSAYPRQLSLGMQQRVALARAFAVRPHLLLLDEPFSALDEVTAATVAEHLLRLWSRERPTVLMVTHRVEEAVTLADRIWIFTPGPARVWASLAVPLERPRRRGPLVWEVVEEVRARIGEAAKTPGPGEGR